MFPGIDFCKLLSLSPERRCPELIIVSSNVQALLFLQDNWLEPVWNLVVQEKGFNTYWARPLQNEFCNSFGAHSTLCLSRGVWGLLNLTW